MSEITVPHVEAPYPFEAYAHVVEPLTEEDGGGYLITFPDLPGCMSDGETEVEAQQFHACFVFPWITNDQFETNQFYFPGIGQSGLDGAPRGPQVVAQVRDTQRVGHAVFRRRRIRERGAVLRDEQRHVTVAFPDPEQGV